MIPSTASTAPIAQMGEIAHILHRPDMYVGDTAPSTHPGECLVMDLEGNVHRVIDAVFSDGLWRIFQEPLSNIIDHAWRSANTSTPLSTIHVSIDRDDHGTCTMENDGASIAATPERIFGQLRTSSNFDDREERGTCGRNGMGVKLTNVFSTFFQAEVHDPTQGVTTRQTWRNNMRDTDGPRRKRVTTKRPVVKIAFTPDWARFQSSADDMAPNNTFFRLFVRKLYEVAMLLSLDIALTVRHENKKRRVTIQGRHGSRGFAARVLSSGSKHMTTCRLRHAHMSSFVLEILLAPSVSVSISLAYVNGMETEAEFAKPLVEDVLRAVLKTLHNQDARLADALRLADVRPLVSILLVANVPNPVFASQCKARCVAPLVDRKDVVDEMDRAKTWRTIVQTLGATVAQWPQVQAFRKRFLADLRRVDDVFPKSTTKKNTTPQAEGYDAANWAGTRRAHQCVLLLCEGLSAKTFAVQGIKKGWAGHRGRDQFGIYPFRGKCLNVYHASAKTICANREWSDLMAILHLESKVDYRDEATFRRLRYGKVVLLTDADTDGVHIASLMMNFFCVVAPSLVARGDVLFWMRAPVARVDNKTFYTESAYRAWMRQHPTAKGARFFKGLGTCTDEDIDRAFGEFVLRMEMDDETPKAMRECFSADAVEQRRARMREASAETTLPALPSGATSAPYPISVFLRHEWVRFSLDDCGRSIPHVMDGLKTSQRKILHAVLTKPLLFRHAPVKVAQLAGYVAELTHYHHGEQCLHETICKMAQRFVGANFANLPLLVPEGQFGSRLYLGKDAASARYIFVKGESYLEHLFPPDDRACMTPCVEDGVEVEYAHYLPVLPLVLVNGCRTGIGTGWSCSIPPFDPHDLLETIDAHLATGAPCVLPLPTYRGFGGTIRALTPTRLQCEGVLRHDEASQTYSVHEIPVSMSIQKYKEFLDNLQLQKRIRDVANFSDTRQAHFRFAAIPPFTPTVETMKLLETIHVNTILHDAEGRLRSFASLDEVLSTFVTHRLAAYERRKRALLTKHAQAAERVGDKIAWVEWLLRPRNLARYHAATLSTDVDGFLQTAGVSAAGRAHPEPLLDIPVRQMNGQRLAQWRAERQTQDAILHKLRGTTAKQLWRADLCALRTILPSCKK